MSKIIFKQPFKEIEIKDTTDPIPYNVIRDGCEGYIELVPTNFFAGTNIDIFCNEEGKLDRLPFNFMTEYDAIVGPVVICAHDKQGESIGLTDEQVEMVKRWFDNA